MKNYYKTQGILAGRILVVLGSARKQSNTEKLLRLILAEVEFTLLDLLDYEIAPYDYKRNYPANDAFGKITATLLEHDIIVWATPVYWYAMSGRLKTCFDRFTDLVTIKKELGRQLAGKSVFLLAVGADPELPVGFVVPFEATAAYLHMPFRAYFYAATSELPHAMILQKRAQPFIATILARVREQPNK